MPDEREREPRPGLRTADGCWSCAHAAPEPERLIPVSVHRTCLLTEPPVRVFGKQICNAHEPREGAEP